MMFVGTIGKLRLQVPWKRLGWDPIIVALEDVVVTSGPREDAEVSEDGSFFLQQQKDLISYLYWHC